MNVVGTETDLSLLYENIHKAGMDDAVTNDINVLSNTIFLHNDYFLNTIIYNNELSIIKYKIKHTSELYNNILLSSPTIINNSSIFNNNIYGITNSTNTDLYFINNNNSSINLYNYINIINLESYSFCNTKITSIITPSSLTCIYDNAFDNSLLTYIEIPSCIKIDDGAFNNCKYLTHIIFPNNLSIMNKYVFSNCISLVSCNLLNTNLQYINSFTFYQCNSLTHISFPSTLLSIDNFAFYGCISLSSFDFTNVKPMKFNEQIFYSSYNCGYSIFVNEKDYDEWINLNNYLLYNETNMSSHIKVLNTNKNE